MDKHVRRLARARALRLALLAALAWASPLGAQQVSIRDALPAVVAVLAIDAQGNPVGSGSGTIVAPTGAIVTNFHVVGSTETGRLYNPDGLVAIFMLRRSDEPARLVAFATVIEGNPSTDLALLQIVGNANGERIDPSRLSLPSLPLGDSDRLEVGDRITILGFPGTGTSLSATSYDNRFFVTLTDATVSGFDREGATRSWIRTTALIMGGNSGGTVLDQNGCLVGVPTASRVNPDRVEQMGYLRPINYVPASWLAGYPVDYCRASAAYGAGGGAQGGGGAPAPASRGVVFSGQIVDANTGRGIPGAYFAIAHSTWRPGMELREEHLASGAQTDASGYFQTTTPVVRGRSYYVIIAAEGYRPVFEEVHIADNLPDRFRFEQPLRLQR
jgi:hypothetical protein